MLWTIRAKVQSTYSKRGGGIPALGDRVTACVDLRSAPKVHDILVEVVLDLASTQA